MTTVMRKSSNLRTLTLVLRKHDKHNKVGVGYDVEDDGCDACHADDNDDDASSGDDDDDDDDDDDADDDDDDDDDDDAGPGIFRFHDFSGISQALAMRMPG